MRLFWIAVVLILVGFAGYSYNKNPAGCWKIINDFGALFASLSPIKVELKNSNAANASTDQSATTSTNNEPAASTDTTSAVSPSPAVSTPGSSPTAPSLAPSPAPSPAPPVLDPNVSGLVPTLLNGNLISAGGGPYVFPTMQPLSSLRFFAIYYAAAWSPACPSFTSELVQWYKGFKPTHANLEVIFVSEDRDEAGQLAFIKQMNMPWPTVRYSALKHDGNGTFKASGIEQFAGTGIPDLVLVDQTGKVLLDSYQNGAYVGPEQVMNGIAAQVEK